MQVEQLPEYFFHKANGNNPSRPDKHKVLHMRKINFNCKYIEMAPN